MTSYLLTFISWPSLIAGAVVTLLCVACINFVLANWLRALKFGLVLLLLAGMLSLVGCGDSSTGFSVAYGHKPAQNALVVRGSDGRSFQLALNADISAQQMIMLQTALANSLVLDADVMQERHETERKSINMRVFYAILLSVCFCVACLSGAAIAIRGYKV